MGVPAGAEQVQRELHADKQILEAEDSQNGLIDLMKATRTKAWPEVSAHSTQKSLSLQFGMDAARFCRLRCMLQVLPLIFQTPMEQGEHLPGPWFLRRAARQEEEMPYHGLHEGLACLLGTQDLIHLHVLVLVLLVVLKESAGPQHL